MVRFYGNGFLEGYEKLRTIKTARFCGRVLFGYPPSGGGASKKLKSFLFL